ncbi:MAG: radical SAM protein, partial [Clostridia bacterium]|nr:radical SAM protein [Clostridia bacterium]
GVTVSGGEPLAQIDFVTELFKILKENGVHTALDTSGVTFESANPESVKKHETLLKYTDLVLLDIKHIDEAEHKALTGQSNKNTLDFAKLLSESGKDIWIRHVLVSGITDDDNYLKKLKEFIGTLKTVKNIEVLPYHKMGEAKYEKLGIPYPLKGLNPPEYERVENARIILKR